MQTPSETQALLQRCYDAFNARDLDGALALMEAAVTWPNGWEGGWLEGRDEVRRYWQRQWNAINPSVEPRTFRQEDDGRIAVSVHQVVRDLTGNVIADQMVEHVYQLSDEGRILRMDIRK